MGPVAKRKKSFSLSLCYLSKDGKVSSAEKRRQTKIHRQAQQQHQETQRRLVSNNICLCLSVLSPLLEIDSPLMTRESPDSDGGGARITESWPKFLCRVFAKGIMNRKRALSKISLDTFLITKLRNSFSPPLGWTRTKPLSVRSILWCNTKCLNGRGAMLYSINRRRGKKFKSCGKHKLATDCRKRKEVLKV